MDDKENSDGRDGDYSVQLSDVEPVAMRYRISLTQAYELLKRYDHDRAALDRAAADIKSRERH